MSRKEASLASEWVLESRAALFFSFKDFFYVYSALPARMPTHQKRAPDLITDGCEAPRSCWDLNSGHLEEQSVLLTAEPMDGAGERTWRVRALSGAGEMAQQSRALTALPEVLSSNPNNHMVAHYHL